MKRLITMVVVSIALVLALALPASAQSIDCDGNVASPDSCLQDNTDNSDNSVSSSPSNGSGTQANNGGEVNIASGDCSAVQVSDIDQDQKIKDQKNENKDNETEAEVEGDVTDDASNDQSASSSNSQSNSASNSQSAWGNKFSADCRQTNVTNVTRAAAQVNAPRGGVGAGAGAATSAQALLGLFGSVGTAGAGLGLRFLKRES